MTAPGVLDAYSQYRERRYFGSLDGLRALSILAVVWHHTQPEFTWLPAGRLGFLGVDMFFVLSGFLIVTLLLREQDRDGDISLRRFYLRRSLRIFPAYYGLLAILALVFWLKPGGSNGPRFFRDLPYLITYTANWIPPASFMALAWSLAMEEQFYLLWPPVEKWLGRRVWLVLILILAVNQAINFLEAGGQLRSWFGPVVADLSAIQITFTPICLGVLLAHVLHSPPGFRRVARTVAAPWAPVVVLGALVLVCNLVPGGLQGWPRLSIQFLMTVLLASCVVREDHRLRPVLKSPPLRRIGVISYGIYLYHQVALFIGLVVLTRTGLRFPLDLFWLCLLFSWLIAELSYRYYETPFLSLKEALSRSPAGSDPGPSRRPVEPVAKLASDEVALSEEALRESLADQRAG
jgi:peptidoglycan/LPS O-acetylase OafA/YrhL